MRGVRVGTRASITPSSSIKRADRLAVDSLGRAHGGANGDRAHQHCGKGRDQCLLEFRITQHFELSLFRRPFCWRVDAGYNSSAVPIAQNREKLPRMTVLRMD
jgi:hypothetical protein